MCLLGLWMTTAIASKGQHRKAGHVETCGRFCLVLASLRSPFQFTFVMDICNTSLLNELDKDNLKLILLFFPLEMHIKFTELHKSCLSKSSDDSICDVVASHSTSMLRLSDSLNRTS